jgi:hypothetical protein
MQRLLLAFTFAASLLACTAGDDDPVPVDASIADDGSATTDGIPGTDAAGACVLPIAPITCTDSSMCTSQCATAVCYNFNQIGMRCTMACTAGGNECPSGWSCNGMGRCRPPN